jgi:2-oxoglutarate ferredoxin oxidoreductase subunit beta
MRELIDPEYFEQFHDGEPIDGDLPPFSSYGVTDPLAGLTTEDDETPKHHQQHRLLRYLRREILPTTFCVGCGGGTVLNSFARAIDEMAIDPRSIVCVTGIGCSSWIPSPYFLCDTLHTTHGRAIAFASGVKVMKPDMHVIVIAGDGDLAGIGGNHLIHAARRNIDLTVFLVNNFIYGMTGGQVSPTTPFGARTTTTPYENVEHPFKIAEIVAAAGAAYVARWTTYHPFQLMESMQTAISRPGFTFVEIMSQCPVSFGKLTGMPEAVTQLRQFRDTSVTVEEAAGMSEEQLEGKIVVGRLASRSRTEFCEGLQRVNRDREVAIRKRLDDDRLVTDTAAMETGR